MTKPNFLYIGGSRSGSNWLTDALKEHPDVFIPPARDVEFFNRLWDRGEVWYFNLFEPGEGKKAIGEVSHDYFLHETTAERIKQLLPDVKLIACLRNPLEAVVSQYEHKSFLLNGSLRQYVETKEAIQKVDFYQRLKPFFDRFDRNQILVLFYDELAGNPPSFIGKVYRFLGIDEQFQPTVLDRRVFTRYAARNRYFTKFVYDVACLFKYKLGLGSFVSALQHAPTVRKIVFKNKDVDRLDTETEEKLYRLLSADYPMLSELIEQELPKGWMKSD